MKSHAFCCLANIPRREVTTTSQVTAQQLLKLPKHVEIRHYDNGEIHIFPLVDQEIELNQIKLDDQSILRGVRKIPGFKPNKFEPYILQTDVTGFHDNKISVETTLNGNVLTSSAGPTLMKSNIYNPFQIQYIKSHNFITMNDDGIWKIKKGTYRVSSPIKIKGHLEIEEGVQLYFDKDSYMLVDGTIEVHGTENYPVRFFPIQKEWKGFYLKSNSQKSYIRI